MFTSSKGKRMTKEQRGTWQRNKKEKGALEKR
jgi:hypothetical protein